VSAVTRHDPGEKLYKITTHAGRYVTVTANKSLLVWNAELGEFREKYTDEIKVGDFVPVAKHVRDYRAEDCHATDEFESGRRAGNSIDTHIPAESYIAGKEYIKGLIGSYFSNNAVISHETSTIELASGEPRLVEDFAFLCSRLGIHAEVSAVDDTHWLKIRGPNVKQFAQQITFDDAEKDQLLKSIQCTDDGQSQSVHNDVILDAIVSIEFVDPALHPKMYDLTIPTTLNFGLANGLQVRDTSSTGYIQRRLIKGMEDLKIEYDMTVRNNKGRVIQFSYGEDGIDPVKVESQMMPLVNMGLDEIYAHYHMPSSDPKDVVFTSAFTKGVISRMKKQKAENDVKCKQWIDFMIEQREKVIQCVFRNKNNDRVYLPVAFAHTINNVKGLQQINNNSIVDITPLEAFAMIEAAYKRLESMHYCAPTQLFKAMFYYYLSPKDLLMVKRFNKKALTVLLEMIVLKYKNSLIAPGEMVGMISAQSIGEPTTQLTLNTFHTAGSGVAMKANVTRGVPRIEELLSITENPKNSSLTIFLKKDEETDCERAKELIAQIELTQLSELVESVSICFDPDDLNTLIQEDRSTMLQYYEYQRMLNECAGIDVPEEAEADPNSARSKWIIRLVMSREAMLDKRITMDDVHFAIKNSHGDDVSCIYADYNADKLVLRLRMNNINGKKPLKPKENPLDQSDKIYLLKAFQDQLLNNIVLRGLKNISKVTLRKLMDTLHKEDGAYVKKETWVLDTKGTNLMDVLALDYIDVNRTISDDIQEIRSVLGIEAAREALLSEMTGVFENDGTYINYHHLSLLCDRMTASSGMVSIFRHGINNDNIGPIAKASFEETPEMFLKAARHAELDQMRGISANVMCGQEGYYGTSSFQVMLDLPQMIAKMEDVAFQAQNEQAEIAEAMGSAAADTSACAFEKLTIESNVGSIQKVDLGQGADNYNVGF
jgi:DNA-directed RNA polymerase II subunit RPB1